MSNKPLWVARYRRAGDEDIVNLCETKEVAENLVKNFLVNALAQHNVMPPVESNMLSIDILDMLCNDIAYFDIDQINILEEHEVYQPLRRSINSIQNMINRIVEVKSMLPTYDKDQNNFVSIGLLYDLYHKVFNHYDKTGFIAEPHEGKMTPFSVSVSNALPLEKTIEKTLYYAFKELYKGLKTFPNFDIKLSFVSNKAFDDLQSKVYVYVVEINDEKEVGSTLASFSFEY